MGNYLPNQGVTCDDEQKKLIDQLKRRVTVQALVQILDEFREQPKVRLEYEEFDLLLSPMLNNTSTLFNKLCDSAQNINFYEAWIVMVLFCKNAEYEERIRLLFDSFDLDHGGSLDRKELGQFIAAAIFGICKCCGIPEPNKMTVSQFVSAQFTLVDEDGSGNIEFEEFQQWINESMIIQDFILRYTGVQTIDRARLVYEQHCAYWNELFTKASVSYFGVRYLEMDTLKALLEAELVEYDIDIRQKLYSIMAYNGEQIIEEKVYQKIMAVWSSFSANDINNDNELDLGEIKMLWWLIEGQKPSNAVLEREMRVMDTDGNGSIDRIEWLAYLVSPKDPNAEALGNKDYFDFELRENFSKAD